VTLQNNDTRMTHQGTLSCSSIYGMPPANGISVIKIVKSYGTRRTLAISLFPVLNRRIELNADQTRALST